MSVHPTHGEFPAPGKLAAPAPVVVVDSYTSLPEATLPLNAVFNVNPESSSIAAGPDPAGA